MFDSVKWEILITGAIGTWIGAEVSGLSGAFWGAVIGAVMGNFIGLWQEAERKNKK